MTTTELNTPRPQRRYLPRKAAVSNRPPVSMKTRWTYRAISVLIVVARKV